MTDRNLLDDINRSLGRIEATVTEIKERQNRSDLFYTAQFKGSDDRISDLEKSEALRKGAAIAYGTLGGAIISFLGYIVFR